MFKHIKKVKNSIHKNSISPREPLNGKPKIAILHDYFRVLGGAEKLVLELAAHLDADIITSEAKNEILTTTKSQKVRIISLGKETVLPALLPLVTVKRFSCCNYSNDYDVFIFSGNYSIYASRNHKPNLWYCHTPLKGLHDG